MNNHIKTILVDDEENALSILEIKIKKYFPQIEIVGKYSNPVQAIEQINTLHPDLLFLDIKMPGYTGFELLEHILMPDFELVFVTAYGEYALDAIKQCAIGYVLKPIDDNEFKIAVLNAINNLQLKTKKSLTATGNKISIPFSNGYLVRDVQTIIRCEGYSGYTKIYFSSGDPITSSYSIGLFNSMRSILMQLLPITMMEWLNFPTMKKYPFPSPTGLYY
jgi:two-component system LytT family response regulator